MIFRLRWFLPLAVAITGICGLIYLTGQQNLRQNANDPQIQMAEDIARQLTDGKTPQLPPEVNPSTSLAPFVITYNSQGEEVLSTVTVDGATPKLPQGVLAATQYHSENRLTWQPKEGVRIAAIVTKYSSPTDSGYVLAGRSLLEVEKREDQLLLLVLVGYAVIMIGSFIATILCISGSTKR